MQPKEHPIATSHEIRRILGPIDEDIVVNIMRTGATSGEVAEAFEWLNADDTMGAELEKSMNEHVRRVYDLLQSERDSINRDE